jgi:hypothetical protein
MKEQTKYLTLEAYCKLYNSIEANTDKYLTQDNSWVKEFLGGEDYYHISTVSVNHFTPILLNGETKDSEIAKIDFKNAKNIHIAYKDLTRYQASQKLFWTYQTHFDNDCYRYSQDRWCITPRENTIKNRFFVTSYGSLFNDSSISRLFLMADLTYEDLEREIKLAKQKNDFEYLEELYAKQNDPNYDPYYLTEILMTNQTLSTDVLDTQNKNNFQRVKGVLYGINEYIKVVGTNVRVADVFRECKKYLNIDAAVRSYDLLSWKKIAEITFHTMLRMKEQMDKADTESLLVTV